MTEKTISKVEKYYYNIYDLSGDINEGGALVYVTKAVEEKLLDYLRDLIQRFPNGYEASAKEKLFWNDLQELFARMITVFYTNDIVVDDNWNLRCDKYINLLDTDELFTVVEYDNMYDLFTALYGDIPIEQACDLTFDAPCLSYGCYMRILESLLRRVNDITWWKVIIDIIDIDKDTEFALKHYFNHYVDEKIIVWYSKNKTFMAVHNTFGRYANWTFKLADFIVNTVIEELDLDIDAGRIGNMVEILFNWDFSNMVFFDIQPKEIDTNIYEFDDSVVTAVTMVLGTRQIIPFINSNYPGAGVFNDYNLYEHGEETSATLFGWYCAFAMPYLWWIDIDDTSGLCLSQLSEDCDFCKVLRCDFTNNCVTHDGLYNGLVCYPEGKNIEDKYVELFSKKGKGNCGPCESNDQCTKVGYNYCSADPKNMEWFPHKKNLFQVALTNGTCLNNDLVTDNSERCGNYIGCISKGQVCLKGYCTSCDTNDKDRECPAGYYCDSGTCTLNQPQECYTKETQQCNENFECILKTKVDISGGFRKIRKRKFNNEEPDGVCALIEVPGSSCGSTNKQTGESCTKGYKCVDDACVLDKEANIIIEDEKAKAEAIDIITYQIENPPATDFSKIFLLSIGIGGIYFLTK